MYIKQKNELNEIQQNQKENVFIINNIFLYCFIYNFMNILYIEIINILY